MADNVGEKPSFPILSHANLFFERKKFLLEINEIGLIVL